MVLTEFIAESRIAIATCPEASVGSEGFRAIAGRGMPRPYGMLWLPALIGSAVLSVSGSILR
jgi:hypothetical protein